MKRCLLVPLPLALLCSVAAAADFDNNVHGDGLNRFGIFGRISPALTTTENKFDYVYGNPDGTTEHIAYEFEKLDKRQRQHRQHTNLDNMNSSHLAVVLGRRITDTLTVGSTISLLASPKLGGGGLEMYTLYDTHFRQRLGRNDKDMAVYSLTMSPFGRRYVSINKTGLDFDPFPVGLRALNFTYIKDDPSLTFNTYYSFPRSRDTRVFEDVYVHESFGAGVQYKKEINPRHRFEIAAGATRARRNSALIDAESEYAGRAPHKEVGYGLGASYKLVDLKLDADVGYKQGKVDGKKIVKAIDTINYGVRVAYDFTPRLNGYIAYGAQDSKAEGVTPDALSVKTIFTNADSNKLPSAQLTESTLFDKVKRKRYMAGASYEIVPDFTVEARFTHNHIDNFVPEGKFSERENSEYSVGLNYEF